MNPLEYYNLVKAKINGLFRREHTPLRVIAGRSRKALLDRKIMDTYSVQLHLDAQGPINDKVKKDIQNDINNSIKHRYLGETTPDGKEIIKADREGKVIFFYNPAID